MTIHRLLFVLLLAIPTVSYAQARMPDSVKQKIETDCIGYDSSNLRALCIEENKKAYISWQKLTTEPEFENISEILSSCSVDWPSYMMRVECVELETKALVRMNNLVNIHGVTKSDMVVAVQACSDMQDMGYIVLETCIREKLVKITGKPLP